MEEEIGRHLSPYPQFAPSTVADLAKWERQPPHDPPGSPPSGLLNRINAALASATISRTVVVLSSAAAKMLQRPYSDPWKLPEV